MSKELLADVVNKQQIKIWAEETRAMEAKLTSLQSELTACYKDNGRLRDALVKIKTWEYDLLAMSEHPVKDYVLITAEKALK